LTTKLAGLQFQCAAQNQDNGLLIQMMGTNSRTYVRMENMFSGSLVPRKTCINGKCFL